MARTPMGLSLSLSLSLTAPHLGLYTASSSTYAYTRNVMKTTWRNKPSTYSA